jgi:hypothetical protein
MQQLADTVRNYCGLNRAAGDWRIGVEFGSFNFGELERIIL